MVCDCGGDHKVPFNASPIFSDPKMWWNDYDRLVYEKDNIFPMASKGAFEGPINFVNLKKKLNPAVSKRLDNLIGENKDRLSWQLLDSEEALGLIEGFQNVSHAMSVFNEGPMREMLRRIGEKELSKAQFLGYLKLRIGNSSIEKATKMMEKKRKEHVFFPALKKSKFQNWDFTEKAKENMEKFMKHSLNFGNGMGKSLSKLDACPFPDIVLRCISSNILDKSMDNPDDVIAKEIDNALALPTEIHGE